MVHSPETLPRSTRHARGVALGTLLVALAAGLACAPEPEALYPRAWDRHDLWLETPEVALSSQGRSQPWRRTLGYLGLDEVRDMEVVPDHSLRAFPQRRAGQIRTLEQHAGSRLVYPVELGDEAYVSFVPLGTTSDPACPCTYRFGVRDAAGNLHELWRRQVEIPRAFAPAAVEIPLADFAGSPVELLFQVEIDQRIANWHQTTALWGSPAVYERRREHVRPGAVPPTTATGPTVPQGRPNVLLLGLDTLRADHVGAFRDDPPGSVGATPSLTPAIDRLAAESDVWTRAFATFNSTNPSFTSILTGLYGKDHGVYDLRTPLPEEHTTLAELFDDAGYDTLAILSASHLRDGNSGLGQGFDQVTRAPHHFAGELAVDMAIDWIGERRQPFFLWLHMFDPHTPTTPPEPYAVGFRPSHRSGLAPVESWTPFRRPGSAPFTEQVLAGGAQLYQGEVAYLDRQIDRLLGYLESHGLLETTVVALVADHGENLGEHGIDSRHVGLWDTTTHVPLLFRWPEEMTARPPAGRRMGGLVQTLDLFPTLAGVAGLPAPSSDGQDLLALAAAGGRGRRAVFMEHADRLEVSVRTSTHRYVRSAGHPQRAAGTYLYDLEADPGETANLSGSGLAIEAELERLLSGWLAERRDTPEARRRDDLSPEELDKLRSLGYL